MSISDSLGGALALATTGIIFTALTTAGASFAGVFALTVVIAVAAVFIAPRVQDRAVHAAAAEAPGVQTPTRDRAS